jgi:hypothetical protein
MLRTWKKTLAFPAALLIVAAACGGSGGDTDDTTRETSADYFNNLQRELDEYAKGISSQAYRYELILTLPDDVRTDAMRLWLNDAPKPYANARDSLSRLSPPKDAADSHSAMVGGIDGMYRFVESMTIGMDPASLLEEPALREALSDPEFAVFGQRFRNACLDVQVIADQSRPGIRLKCEMS